MLSVVSMMFFSCNGGMNEPEDKGQQTETPSKDNGNENENENENPSTGGNNGGSTEPPQEALKVVIKGELQEDGRTVQFTDQTKGAKKWSWDFGDGQTSTQQNPKHTYPIEGKQTALKMYTVTVKVTDDKGRTAEGATVVTTINKCPEILNMTIIPSSGLLSTPTVGEEINFSAMVSTVFKDNCQYKWEFGDGATANTEKTTHVYSKEGTYQVKLTVSDKGGSTSKTQSITVKKAKAVSALLAWYQITALSLNKSWDLGGSGPDVYVEIYKEGSNKNLGQTSNDRKEDVTSSMLPILISPALSLDIDSKYTMKIYDYDPLGLDELMASLTLDVPTLAANWQEEVTLSKDGCTIKVNLLIQ